MIILLVGRERNSVKNFANQLKYGKFAPAYYKTVE